VLDVWGEDVAVLIGKGGNTLDAIQYLVNICCRRTGIESKRIVVDIEGYRKRRKSRLEKEAEQLARRVIEQKKSLELPPMTPSERKTVHMVLSNVNGVRTESEGEDLDRRVVIYPDENRST
jgi:spoIIIJ-associated protein